MSMSLDFIFVSCMFLNDSTSYSEEQEQVEEEQKINEPSSYGFQPDGKCVFFSPIEFRDINYVSIFGDKNQYFFFHLLRHEVKCWTLTLCHFLDTLCHFNESNLVT